MTPKQELELIARQTNAIKQVRVYMEADEGQKQLEEEQQWKLEALIGCYKLRCITSSEMEAGIFTLEMAVRVGLSKEFLQYLETKTERK